MNVGELKAILDQYEDHYPVLVYSDPETDSMIEVDSVELYDNTKPAGVLISWV